jgi:ABC-type branched-subunit amino acid transport system substrate-binding protein
MVYRIGMVVPLEGPGGLFAASAEASVELATAQINSEGGILGERLDLTWINAGAPSTHVTSCVDGLIQTGQISAVCGWHISAIRNALVPVIAGRVPYVYPALYEGGENRSGVYCTGEHTVDAILPAMNWFRQEKGIRNWFVIGDKYEWPLQSFYGIQTKVETTGLHLCGHVFLNYQSRRKVDTDAALDQIERSGCDGIIVLMVGQNAVTFNREFGRTPMARSVVRLCPLTDENILLANGAVNNSEIYSLAGYFRTLATSPSIDLIRNYTHYYSGTAPALSAPAESCLESLFALRKIVNTAGSSNVRDTDQVIDGLKYYGPRGAVSFTDNQAQQEVYLGKADGLEFDVLTDLAV